MLSMTEAAKQAGVSKATIHRAIKAGRLSASRQEDGSYEIDPAELFRVYKPVRHLTPVSVRQDATPSETGAKPHEIERLEARVRDLEERVSDLKNDRDAWRQQAERLALAAPVQATPAPQRRRGFLGWFKGD